MNRLGWARIKRHAALPLVCIVVIVVAVILTEARSSKEHGTYAVQNLYGNSELLEDIVISGAIVDSNHHTSFIWHGNEVDTNTKVYSHAQNEWRYRYSSGFYQQIGGYYYSTLPSGFNPHEFYITRQQFKANRYVDQQTALAIIPLDLMNNKGNNTFELTNNITYGLAEVNDELFFTAVTTNRYKGTNGIYKLYFDSANSFNTPAARKRSTAIMTYSLDHNLDETSPPVSVLGLEAVGNKLALILVKGDKLVIEGYDTEGKALGEVEVADFLMTGTGNDEAGDTVHYYETYEAYSRAGSEMLTLSWRGSNKQRLIVSVDFAGGMKLADVTTIKTEAATLVEDEDYEHGVRFITFKNGKLYYVSVYRQVDERDGSHIHYMKQIRFLLSVYEQGQLMYQGELLTDVNDDLIRINQRNLMDFSYDPLQYRSIFDVRID